MDPHLPHGMRTSSTASGNRLKIVVTDKTVALVMAGIAFGASILGLVNQSSYSREHTAAMQAAETRWGEQHKETEREARMLEYYLLELDAKVIASGLKPESDSIAKKLEAKRKEKGK